MSKKVKTWKCRKTWNCYRLVATLKFDLFGEGIFTVSQVPHTNWRKQFCFCREFWINSKTLDFSVFIILKHEIWRISRKLYFRQPNSTFSLDALWSVYRIQIKLNFVDHIEKFSLVGLVTETPFLWVFRYPPAMGIGDSRLLHEIE